jgi:sterol desaturase/sphingolipid hydroxylase (fatty acid hydroxylase superfamily)
LPVYDSLFATAAGHDLHHSIREPTNVSVVLSVCDRLFGTHQKASYRPDTAERVPVGRVQGAGSGGK